MIISVKRFPFDFLQTITLALIFLGGMNVINRYYYFCFAAVMLFILFKQRLVMDVQVLVLLVLSLSWVVFSPDLQSLSITTILKPFLYPLAYIVGRNFFVRRRQSADGKQRKDPILLLVTVLSFGPFAHYLLNYAGGIGSSSRNTVDIWTHTVLSATGQAALACMMIGVAVAALFMHCKWITKLAAVLALLLLFMYNLILAGRTLLLVLAIVALVCSVYSFKENPSFTRRFKIISLILGVALLAYALYSYNAFGIREQIESSNIYLRFINKTTADFFSGGRLELKQIHLEHFTTALWGGSLIRGSGVGYAHDLWLDAYDEAGILVLIALIVITIRSVWVLLRVVSNKRIDFSVRLMLLSVYTSLYLEFFVEPIIQGVPWLFVFFCVINGLTEYVYYGNRRKDEDDESVKQ